MLHSRPISCCGAWHQPNSLRLAVALFAALDSLSLYLLIVFCCLSQYLLNRAHFSVLVCAVLPLYSDSSCTKSHCHPWLSYGLAKIRPIRQTSGLAEKKGKALLDAGYEIPAGQESHGEKSERSKRIRDFQYMDHDDYAAHHRCASLSKIQLVF